MSKLKKPEKKDVLNIRISTDRDLYNYKGGYNQAVDDWEAYHKSKIQSIVDRLERLDVFGVVPLETQIGCLIQDLKKEE